MLSWFASRDNVTFFIAVVGLLMSIYNFVKAMWDSRFGIGVTYISHWSRISRNNKGVMTMRLLFENKSSRPFTVTRIFLDYDGKRYEFLFPAQKVWEFEKTRNGVIIEQSNVMSRELPFNVEGYGAVGGYFVVALPPDVAQDFARDKQILLTVHTNHKKKQVSFFAYNHGSDIKEYGK